VTLLVWVYLVIDSHGFNPFKSMKRFIASMPPVGRVVFCALLAGFIVYGSTKSGGGDTNSPPSRMSAPRRTPRLADVVAPEDIARGWRVVTSTEAEGLAEMPVGAVTNDLLRRRGGYDWAFRVEPEGWRFPYRDGALDGVTVLARGEVRPDVGTLYFPAPLTNGVSLLPEARWGLLPDGGASVFSHAVTTNDSLLLDWRNALVDRDVNTPTNLQMELFSDGSFVWRTDDGSTSYLPVFPFDWDGDGLENSVDPEPLSPNSIDAHGTNAEWYRIVCSNVFEVTGTTGVPPVDNGSTDPGTTGILPVEGGLVQFKTNANDRAYYFVDVVAEKGPAPIYFNADRDSRLGSPVVVARAGETNRVPLLVGVEYTVTSTVPIAVSAPDAMYATVTSNGARSVTVKWPLEFSYSVSGESYVVSVEPYDPGGAIEWERSSLLDSFNIGGGAGLLSVPSPSGCGFTTGSRSLTFTCANCSCAGCMVSGVFRIEEACFDLGSFCCGCVYDPHGEDHPGENPGTPSSSDSPGVSVSFNKPVVIFEDAYANTFTETIGKQSTSTTVKIEAYGGSEGGVVVVTMENYDKLECTGGPSLPTAFMVGPYSQRSISVEYQGNRASGSADDIVVTAQMSGASSSASATAVRVGFKPKVPIAGIPCRHVVGVRESVGVTWEPSSVSLSMSASQDEELVLFNNEWRYRAPLQKTSPHLMVTCQGLSLPLNVEIKEPEYVFVRTVDAFDYNVPTNIAGGAGMELALYVYPTNVSFMGIAVQEVPSDYRDPWGYFNHIAFQDLWSHTRARAAGVWHDIQVGNLFMFDVAEMGDELPCMAADGSIVDDGRHCWISGGMNWMIPVGWNETGSDDDDDLPVKTFATYWQRFSMSSTGHLKVEKLEEFVERGTNNVISLNGTVQQQNNLRPR